MFDASLLSSHVVAKLFFFFDKESLNSSFPWKIAGKTFIKFTDCSILTAEKKKTAKIFLSLKTEESQTRLKNCILNQPRHALRHTAKLTHDKKRKEKRRVSATPQH